MGQYIAERCCLLCAVMKRAVFVGAILGCIVLFACGVALSTFLVVTHWLAPAHAHFQQELFFDYTRSEATASTQFCPTLNGKVGGLWHISSHHLQLCPDTLPPVLVLGTVLLMPTCLHVSYERVCASQSTFAPHCFSAMISPFSGSFLAEFILLVTMAQREVRMFLMTCREHSGS